MARILVVEDEFLNALSLKEALLSEGHTVCGVAHTAGEAVR
jgi:CheY-like chemotaxis protein